MADSGDDDKSGYSDAFKRAAVKFGVARYLYRDGVPTFVQERDPGRRAAAAGRAGPGPGRRRDRRRHRRRPPRPRTAAGRGDRRNPPRTGKALFAWTKDQEQRHEVGLLKYLNQWAKLQDFPGRMIDWDAEQVSLAYQEACRKLQSLQTVEPRGLRRGALELNRSPTSDSSDATPGSSSQGGPGSFSSRAAVGSSDGRSVVRSPIDRVRHVGRSSADRGFGIVTASDRALAGKARVGRSVGVAERAAPTVTGSGGPSIDKGRSSDPTRPRSTGQSPAEAVIGRRGRPSEED